MNIRPRLITRIALFSALIYVLSWATAFLPNVNLAFFIAFSAGFLWGLWPGLAVGAIGMWLWTSFNPYGPASLPVMLAQVSGMATCGLIGYGFNRMHRESTGGLSHRLWLVLAAIACTISFYLPVTVVDAWVYQPFWPRLITGLPWIGISLVANAIVFVVLFGVTLHLQRRELGART